MGKLIVILSLIFVAGCGVRPTQQWAPVGTLVQYSATGATQSTIVMNPQLRQPTAKDFAPGDKVQQVALLGHCDILTPQGATVATVRMNPQLGEPVPPPKPIPGGGFWDSVLGFVTDPTILATGIGLLFGGAGAAVPFALRLTSVLRGASAVVSYSDKAETIEPTPERIAHLKDQEMAKQIADGTLPVVRQLLGKAEPSTADVWADRISSVLGFVTKLIPKK
jgi:hypothetical protein